MSEGGHWNMTELCANSFTQGLSLETLMVVYLVKQPLLMWNPKFINVAINHHHWISPHPISVRYIFTLSCHLRFLHVVFPLAVSSQLFCRALDIFHITMRVLQSYKFVAWTVLHRKLFILYFFLTAVTLCRVSKFRRILEVCYGVRASVSPA